MKYVFLILISSFWLKGFSQIDNLKLIDEAEKSYFNNLISRTRLNNQYENRHKFKRLEKLLLNKDTVYLCEVMPSFGSYGAFLYTGNGDVILIGKRRNGKMQKSREPRISLINVHLTEKMDYDLYNYLICYIEWFKTFDKNFLDKLLKQEGPEFDADHNILIRIIKGKVDIVYTNVHLDFDIDPITGIAKCPSLH